MKRELIAKTQTNKKACLACTKYVMRLSYSQSWNRGIYRILFFNFYLVIQNMKMAFNLCSYSTDFLFSNYKDFTMMHLKS